MVVTFSDPQYLWLLAFLPLFLVTHFYSLLFVKRRAVRLANFEALARVSGRKKISFNWFILLIRFLALFCLIFSCAGMVFWYEGKSSDSDFILAIDASGSMLAQDFSPNRLEAAKQSALLFVDSVDSRAQIGVVSFSGLSEVEHPLSSNFFSIKQAISSITFKSIHGTAIGDALKTAQNQFSGQKPKTVILLTDGQENVISKDEFSRLIAVLRKQQVTVHTISIGTASGGIVPGIDITSTVDSTLLKEIASATNGQYFSTKDVTALEEAYKQIAQASRGKIPIELRIPLILAAIMVIFFEWGLINTKFKTIP